MGNISETLHRKSPSIVCSTKGSGFCRKQKLFIEIASQAIQACSPPKQVSLQLNCFSASSHETPLPAHGKRWERGAKGKRRVEPSVSLDQSLMPDTSDWNSLGLQVLFAPVHLVLNTAHFHH